LYLFLFADLLCSAAAFPVFYGLYSRRVDGTTATISTIGGLVAGLALFPAPNAPLTYLLESFVLAAVVPVVITFILNAVRRNVAPYDLQSLKHKIRGLDHSSSTVT